MKERELDGSDWNRMKLTEKEEIEYIKYALDKAVEFKIIRKLKWEHYWF